MVDRVLGGTQRFLFAFAKGLLLLLLLWGLDYAWLPTYGIGNYIAWLHAWYTLW